MQEKGICHTVTAPWFPSFTAAMVLIDVPELNRSSVEKNINERWLSLPAYPVAVKFLKVWTLKVCTWYPYSFQLLKGEGSFGSLCPISGSRVPVFLSHQVLSWVTPFCPTWEGSGTAVSICRTTWKDWRGIPSLLNCSTRISSMEWILSLCRPWHNSCGCWFGDAALQGWAWSMNSSTPFPRHRILSEGKAEVVLHLPGGLGTGPLQWAPQRGFPTLRVHSWFGTCWGCTRCVAPRGAGELTRGAQHRFTPSWVLTNLPEISSPEGNAHVFSCCEPSCRAFGDGSSFTVCVPIPLPIFPLLTDWIIISFSKSSINTTVFLLWKIKILRWYQGWRSLVEGRKW